jgi:enoyl-CoA hydratase/carnithine racemase
MAGTVVRILGDDGRDCAPGEEGEIALIGPEQFLGYSDPRRNDDAFTPGGWFLSGDIGVLDADGFLTVTDRKKDIIIRGGENISSVEVESILLRHAVRGGRGEPRSRARRAGSRLVVLRRRGSMTSAEYTLRRQEAAEDTRMLRPDRRRLAPHAVGQSAEARAARPVAGRAGNHRRGGMPMIDYRTDGPIARITIRRPEKHNALTPALVRDLVAAVDRAGADDVVKVVLIDGEGPAFCAGFDIGDPDDFEGARASANAIASPASKRRPSGCGRCSRLQCLSCWRARLVHRYRHALVMVADFAIASDDASFGLPEERFGSAGATWAYPFLMLDVGLKRATEIVMTGRRFDAGEAHQMGLLTRVVARDRLADECEALVAAIVSLPREGIAVNRAMRNLALSFTGHLNAFAFHAVAHPLVEHMTRDPEEFDFMAEVERQGLRGAVSERNRRFGGPYWGW